MKNQNKELHKCVITQKAIEVADTIKKEQYNNIIDILKNLNYYERRSFLYSLYEQLNLMLFDLEIKELLGK